MELLTLTRQHRDSQETVWNSWEPLPSTATEPDDDDDADSRSDDNCSSGWSEDSSDTSESAEDIDDDACVIPSDFRLLFLADHQNQSSCNVGEAFTWQAQLDEPAETDKLPPVEAGLQWDLYDQAEGWQNFQTPPPRQQQQLITCEEDVIGQRLNYCLQQLQGGPFQDCSSCVKTLSSCDQNQLPTRELLDRLNNVELLLLYLQVRFRSHMSCGRLKLLCQLKKTLACMHGCLLKRQAEDVTSEVERQHRRLDRAGDFRRHWRPVPAGGENFHFVGESLDCTPRVEAEDAWLLDFLPASEQPALGHILADADPPVPEQLGKRMAFTKLRGRSTRLHNLFTRDAYEDMLRHFQFALA